MQNNKGIMKFVAGIVAGLSVAVSVLAANNISGQQSRRDTQICALDRAIVTALVRSGKNIPPDHKYDRYRRQNALDIADIQAASAC